MVLVKMYLHQDLICCPQPPSLVQLPPHLTSRNRGQNRMNITVTQELPSSTVSGTYISVNLVASFSSLSLTFAYTQMF